MTHPAPGDARPRAALVLPNAMAARNTLETPLLGELAASGLELTLLTPQEQDREPIQAAGGHLSWLCLDQPFSPVPGLDQGGPALAGRRLLHRLAQRLWGPWAGFANLVYRFNEVSGFVGHRIKKDLPPQRQEREGLAGNYCSPHLGRPWPGSRALLNLVKRLYYTTWYSEPACEAFLDRFRPHLLVLHHLQNQAVRPWACAARRRGLPVLGLVGSWDQPSTKGPLCPGVSRYVVQSRRMAWELERWHQVPPELVEVVGWPQMDFYRAPGVIKPREELCARLGLPPQRKLLVLGANSARLGAHEPAVARHLARRLAQGAYPGPASLVLRPHPHDDDTWQERLGVLHDPPQVVVLPPQKGDLAFLANLLAHAQVVLATAGTICLDAIALDTPVVALALDGDQPVPYHQSVGRCYKMDHYAPVVASGGLRLAGDWNQLDAAVTTYLNDPSADAAGRDACRAQQLEPFDGQASVRLAGLIQSMARQAAAHA